MNAFMCVIFTQSIRRHSLARLLININLYQSGFLASRLPAKIDGGYSEAETQ